MAKIPLGEFGQVTPQFRQSPMTSSVDGGLSEAMQRFGNTALAIGEERQAQGARIEEQRAAEAKRASQQREADTMHELRAAQELADRTMAVGATKGIGVDARDLADDFGRRVAAGEIQPGDVPRRFDEAAQKVVNARLQGIDPAMAGFIKANTLDAVGAARNRAVDAATAQVRHGVRADLVNIGEAFERSAMDDREGSVRQYGAMLQTMGPQAGLTPEQIATTLQSFKERTSYNLGAALVRGARDDPKALDATAEALRGTAFADMSPERLGQLDTQIMNRRQLLESKRQTAIARGEAAAARRDREAQAAMTSMQTLIDNGAVPDQATMTAISAKVSGTPYAAQVKELIVGSAKAASFAQLAPQQQEAAILEMRQRASEQGSNPALERRIDRFSSIKAKSEKQLADDPLMYGVNRRLIEIEPLQFSNLDQLAQQISQRADAAHTVTARTGVATSPLLASEAHQAATMLAALPLPQRQQVVQSLAKRMDPGMVAALGKQVDGKDGALGAAIFAAANMPPVVSELILQGQDARAAGRIKDDVIATSAQRDIAKELAKVPWPTTTARDAAVAAAGRVYDGLRDKNGSASASEAVRHVTNGLADWAGSRVPMPKGYTESQFKRELRSIDAKTLAKQSGAFDVVVGGDLIGVDKLAANMDTVVLIPAGGGYALSSGGKLVMRRSGGPLVIKLGE